MGGNLAIVLVDNGVAVGGRFGRRPKLEKRRDPMVAKVVVYRWIGNSYVHFALFLEI